MRGFDRGLWSDLGKVAAGCAVFAASISAAGVRAAEDVVTNLDLMQQLTAQVVAELHGKFNASVNGRTVQLKPAGTSEDYVFVTNVFREELIRLGVKTVDPDKALTINSVTPPASGAGAAGAAGAGGNAANQANPGYSTPSPSPGYPGSSTGSTIADSAGTTPLTLQYQNVVFELKYVDSHRAFMVGGKRVDRRASVRIITTLSDETGQVLWVGEAEREHNDEIDYADAARVEQGTYQFNRAVVPESGWGKVIEPVFVTGIIVGLIYLFFSNQSDE